MASKGSKNASILSFFKPASSSQQASQPNVSQHSPSKSLSSAPPSSLPSSQPRTPVKPAPSRNDLEIGASDDDGDGGSESDDSLEDLSALLGRSRPGNAVPATSRAAHNPFATPKAKRTALEFHTSPLTIMPKHKFDMKALTKDARRDDATHASSMRVSALKETDEAQDTADAAASDHAFTEIVREKGGHDAQKVLRAVQRAQPGQSELRYCFFDTRYQTPLSSKPPKKAARGPWGLVTQGSAEDREQHLISGVPSTLLLRNIGMPDDLFVWALEELCVQDSTVMRDEYVNLLDQCPEQVERLVTPERLENLFLRLGASEDLSKPNTDINLSANAEDPYLNRDWSCFRSFLTLLGQMGPHLSTPAATYATQTLLRLSLDKMLIHNIDLLNEYETTIQSLLSSIASSHWGQFCFETCSWFHKRVKTQCIIINAMLCLPMSHPQVHDLRRRLAVTCLFNDPKLGRCHPEDIVTLRRVIDRLDQADFTVGPNTDFAELRAGIILLDIVIDDGSIVTTNELEDEKKFNSEVDELAQRLRDIWRKINDAGMRLARTETKSVIEWVQQRLSHTVRTKRKPKKSIFDIPTAKEDPSLPQQQDYMKNFLKKQPAAI